MSATNTARWIGVGLLGLPLYGALTFWSSMDPQPDPNTHYEAFSRFVTTDHYVGSGAHAGSSRVKYLSAPQSSAAVPEVESSGRGPRGRLLVLARAAWVVVAVLTLILFVVAIPAAFERFQTACSAGECVYGQLSREGLRALQGLGLSPEFYAAYVVVLDVVFAAVYVAVAALIF